MHNAFALYMKYVLFSSLLRYRMRPSYLLLVPQNCCGCLGGASVALRFFFQFLSLLVVFYLCCCIALFCLSHLRRGHDTFFFFLLARYYFFRFFEHLNHVDNTNSLACPDLGWAEDVHQDQQRSNGSHMSLEPRLGREGNLRDVTGELLTVRTARGGGDAV